jgi:hypothetical protein
MDIREGSEGQVVESALERFRRTGQHSVEPELRHIIHRGKVVEVSVKQRRAVTGQRGRE